MDDNTQTQAESAPSTGLPDQAQSQTTETTTNNLETTQTSTSRSTDHDRIQRLSDQVNGNRRMMDPLRAAGVETPEQVNTMLAAYAQHKAINSAGIDTSALLGGAQKEIQTQTQGVPLTRESMREELAEMNATEVHESGVRSYNSGIDAIAKELAGEGVEVSMVMDEINRAAKQFLVENGKRYAPGHPLAAHQSAYIPPTASDLAQIKIAAQSIIDQKRGFHTRVKAQTPMTTPMGTSQRTDGAVDQNMTAIDRLRSKQEEARAIVDRKFNG